MRRVLIIRHATSEWNAEGRWQGHADPALSEAGRAEAAAAVERLRGRVHGVAASDLTRALETAEILAEALDIGPVVVEPGMREIDVGEWSGLTGPQIDERWPGQRDAWRAGRLDAIPGGEDRASFLERILAAVARVAALDWNGDVAVVTHAGVIGILERHLGVHPGSPVPRLAGRWLEVADGLAADGERYELLSG